MNVAMSFLRKRHPCRCVEEILASSFFVVNFSRPWNPVFYLVEVIYYPSAAFGYLSAKHMAGNKPFLDAKSLHIPLAQRIDLKKPFAQAGIFRKERLSFLAYRADRGARPFLLGL